MTRYVLGLNAYHGDSAACLLADGEVVMAIEEERLSRVKHCAGFPGLAVRACLDAARIAPDALGAIAISRRPAANLHKKVLHALGRLRHGGALADRLANAARVADVRTATADARCNQRYVLSQLVGTRQFRAVGCGIPSGSPC